MRKGIVLLVEDNPDYAVLALRGLKKLANKVVHVVDGAEALDYLNSEGRFSDRDNNDLPAVVLLDLKLPKVDGLEVLRKIRSTEHLKHLPVVVLTSSVEHSDLKACYDLGCNSYIRKPVDFEQFSKAVEHLQIYWLLLNEPPPSD